MTNTFHDTYVGHNNHVITANPDDVTTGYADIAARDADTLFQVTANINKVIRVEAPSPAFYVLVSVSPTVWGEFTSTTSDSFLELNDTPSSYSGEAGKVVQVNSAQDAVEFGQQLRTTDSPTFAQINADNLRLDGNTFSTQNVDGNLLITPNGTGSTRVSNNLLTNSAMSIGSFVAPETDASIDLKDATKAFLVNRGTTAQRDALTPVEGMVYYNLDTHDLETYNNTIWESASGGDVVGASSSLDNSVPTWNGTSGKVIKDSGKVSINPITGDINVAGDMILGIAGPSGAAQISPRDDESTMQLRGSVTSGSGAYLIMDSSDKSGSFINTYGDLNAPIPSGASFLVRSADDGVINDRLVVNKFGQVGIGTSNPSAELHVEKSGGELIGLYARNTGGGSGAIFSANNSDNDLSLYCGTGGSRIQTGTNEYLAFHTNCTTGSFPRPANEKMRITSDGDVGIGTTSPTAKLEVEVASGVSAFAAGTALTKWTIGAFDGGNNYLLSQGTAIPAVIGTQNDAPLQVFVNNGGVATFTHAAGEPRLGIGTGNPITTLDVSSDVVGQGRVSTDETSGTGLNNPGFMLHSEGVFKGGIFFKEPNGIGAVEIFDALNPRIIINEWGVGIDRTPAINETLSLNGIANFTGGIFGHGTLISETDTFIFGNAGNGGIGSMALKELKLGIGTLSPASELHVVGNAFIDGYQQNYWGLAVSKTTGWDNANTSIQLKETTQSIALNNVPTATRDGYTTPIEGMFHYNSDLNVPEYRDADSWRAVTSDNIVYVKTQADLPDPIGFNIYLEANTRYVGDNHATVLTLDPLVNLYFAENTRLEYLSLSMSGSVHTSVDFEFTNCLVWYTGTETLLDMTNLSGISQVRSSTFTMTSTGTLFNLDSSIPNTAVIWDTIGLVGSGPGSSLGTISGVTFSVRTVRALYYGEGLTFTDCVEIGIDQYVSLGINTATTHLSFNGTTQGNVQIAGFSPTVQSNEYAFNFDAATSFNGVVTVIGGTVNDADRVFEAGSKDQTTVGFKFLGNANIPDSTSAIHLNALDQASVSTVLTQDTVKRVLASYTEIDSERFDSTVWGNMQYTGGEDVKFLLNASITGTVSTGTNIPFNFYVAKNNAGLVVDSMADAGGGNVTCTTNIPHGYQNGDRVILENTLPTGFYDGEYVVSGVTSLTFNIVHAFTVTSIGYPAMVLINSKASNDFSGADKFTGLITMVELKTSDTIFICTENTGSNANWLTSDIQAVLTKI